jgi:hypothetical protein
LEDFEEEGYYEEETLETKHVMQNEVEQPMQLVDVE